MPTQRLLALDQVVNGNKAARAAKNLDFQAVLEDIVVITDSLNAGDDIQFTQVRQQIKILLLG